MKDDDVDESISGLDRLLGFKVGLVIVSVMGVK